MKAFALWSLLILSLLFQNVVAQSHSSHDKTRSTVSLSQAQLDEIHRYITERIDADDPGIAYGVVRDGQVLLESYYGLASLHHQVPVTEETRFNIASVAKQFTALMVLDLALKGKLDLEDDFRVHLPGLYPEIEAPIRIRHLINHTSGIRDVYDLLSIQHKPWWRQVGMDNEDAIALLERQDELNVEPGSDYGYSNSNYLLLTKIIEVASGVSFHEYAREFFDRLGMPHSEYNRKYMYVIPQIAIPYSDWGDGVWQEYPHMTNLYGDGFLYTTLKDQLAYEMAVQEAGDALLTLSQSPIENAEITTYGFGLELGDRLGRPAVHHSGSTGSNHAQTLRFPEEHLSIVVMSNNGTTWSGYVANHIASVVLPDRPVKREDSGLDETDYAEVFEAEALVGEYVPSDGSVIRIRQEEGRLVWRQANNSPLGLVQESGGIYHFEYDPDIKLRFQTDRFTEYNPGNAPRVYSRMPAFSPDVAYKESLTGTYYSDELDVTFKVYLDEDTLMLYNDARDRSFPVEIIQKDHLLLGDFIITPCRGDGLCLTINRVRDVRFVRQDGLLP